MTQPQIQTVKRYVANETIALADGSEPIAPGIMGTNVVLASDYEALEQRVEKLERDWKEKCIEADTMRQHHKNAEASLREQEERTNRVIHLLKEDWISNYAFRHNQIVQGKWEDAIIEAQARWFESPTRAALSALRERVGPAKAGSCASAPVSPSLPTEGQG